MEIIRSTASIENSTIPYKKRVAGEDGKIIYEDAVFDIKNKTFEKLPDELKEKFDEYQIETVIHESCDSFIISRYIKRYNNHVAMNAEQKAFTYIDKFASRIREILNSRFFVECNNYSEKDKTKGVVERIVVESIMCMNHFDNWKTQPKPACKYLNNHATEEEFDVFADNLHRLEKVITEEIKEIFNKKDSFVFLTLFDKFTKLGVADEKFADFLREFRSNLRRNKRNSKGMLYDEIDKDASTKDKQVITDKLELLETLMLDFLHSKSDAASLDVTETFIAENLGMDVETVKYDMDFYNESLDDLTGRTIKDGSKLLQKDNRLSLLTMVVYSYQKDIDLDEWLASYAKNNNTYFVDQKRNFIHMRQNFEQWQRENRKSA